MGLLFSAGIYPVTMILWQRDQSEYSEAMMLSLYVTLGIFLLLAVRNPSANRSLIAFAAWSSFAHAAVMAIQAFQSAGDRRHLLLDVAIPLSSPYPSWCWLRGSSQSSGYRQPVRRLALWENADPDIPSYD